MSLRQARRESIAKFGSPPYLRPSAGERQSGSRSRPSQYSLFSNKTTGRYFRTAFSNRSSAPWRNPTADQNGDDWRGHKYRPGFTEQRKSLSTTAYSSQHLAVDRSFDIAPPSPIPHNVKESVAPIRQRLQLWQDEHGIPNLSDDVLDAFPLLRQGDANPISRLSEKRINDMAAPDKTDPFEAIDDDTRQLFNIVMRLKPGDLVEDLDPSTSRLSLMVFVNYLTPDLLQFIDARGRWVQRTTGRVLNVTLANFIGRELIQQLIPFMPEKAITRDISDEVGFLDASIPRHITAPMLEAIRAFEDAADDVYRANCEVIDNAYENLAHDTKLRTMTDNKITRELLPHIKHPEEHHTYAIRKAMMGLGLKITFSTPTFKITKSMHIRPKREMNDVYRVRSWAREYQEHTAVLAKSSATSDGVPIPEGYRILTDFASKARRLVATSRQRRQPSYTGRIGIFQSESKAMPPSSRLKRLNGTQFSTSDTTIIHLLEEYCLSKRLWREPELRSTVAAVIRAMGDYGAALECDPNKPKSERIWLEGIAFHLLQELGVLHPAQNPMIFDENLMIPTLRLSWQIDTLNHIAQKAQPDALKDGLMHLRSNIEETVFCIDDATAVEIDDGISVKPAGAPGSNQWWLSIHIANPTAFLQPDHVASKLAAHVVETLYLPEQTLNMLPSWLVDKNFSLRGGRPCLTFSVRIDEDGNVYEHRIEPGKIHKSIALTHRTAAKIADVSGQQTAWGRDGRKFELFVGEKAPLPTINRDIRADDVDAFTEEEKNAIKTIDKLARALKRKRTSASILREWRTNAHQVSSDINVHWSGDVSPNEVSRHISAHIEGDPGITRTTVMNTAKTIDDYITVSRWSAEGTDMVEECMLLAGHVAGTFLADRRVPAIFRGMVPDIYKEAREAFQRDVLEPAVTSDDRVSSLLASTLNTYSSKPVDAARPLAHDGIGYNVFARVTSPLRRYADMITHWQIEAVLKREDAAGRKLTLGHDVSGLVEEHLPFSQALLDRVVNRNSARVMIARSCTRLSDKYWLAVLLERARVSNESNVPETFLMSIDRRSRHTGQGLAYKGTIVNYEFAAELDATELASRGGLQVMLGDIWEVRMKDVASYHTRFRMEPVKLVQRSEHAGVLKQFDMTPAYRTG